MTWPEAFALVGLAFAALGALPFVLVALAFGALGLTAWLDERRARKGDRR